MNLRPNPSAPIRWLLAALVPGLIGAIEYAWLEASSSGPGCEMGPWSPSLASLGILAFMAPWAVALYVWCTSRSLRKAWAPMLVSVVVAVPVVLFVFVSWAGVHQCFE